MPGKPERHANFVATHDSRARRLSACQASNPCAELRQLQIKQKFACSSRPGCPEQRKYLLRSEWTIRPLSHSLLLKRGLLRSLVVLDHFKWTDPGVGLAAKEIYTARGINRVLRIKEPIDIGKPKESKSSYRADLSGAGKRPQEVIDRPHELSARARNHT